MNNAVVISQYQPLLQAIAYNLVRCKEDAEDIVQETFLRWLTIGDKKIENIKGYLIKSVTNNCINHLQSIRKKKVDLFSQINIKEIISRFRENNLPHLDFDVNLQSALKSIQSKLEPLERAVYLLKEVFDFDYETIQETFDKKKDHCRQLFCRAKKKLQEDGEQIKFPEVPHWIDKFKAACDLGHIGDLIDELKSDISTSLKR